MLTQQYIFDYLIVDILGEAVLPWLSQKSSLLVVELSQTSEFIEEFQRLRNTFRIFIIIVLGFILSTFMFTYR